MGERAVGTQRKGGQHVGVYVYRSAAETVKIVFQTRRIAASGTLHAAQGMSHHDGFLFVSEVFDERHFHLLVLKFAVEAGGRDRDTSVVLHIQALDRCRCGSGGVEDRDEYGLPFAAGVDADRSQDAFSDGNLFPVDLYGQFLLRGGRSRRAVEANPFVGRRGGPDERPIAFVEYVDPSRAAGVDAESRQRVETALAFKYVLRLDPDAQRCSGLQGDAVQLRQLVIGAGEALACRHDSVPLAAEQFVVARCKVLQ